MATRTTAEILVPAPTTTDGGRLRTLLVASGLLGAAVVGGVAVLETFRLVQAAVYGEDFLLTFAVGGTLSTLFLFVLAFAYLRVHPIAVPVRRLSRRQLGWVGVGIVVPLLAGVVLSMVGSVLGVGGATNGLDSVAAANPVLVYSLAFVSVLVLIAPAEELLFRGVVQGRLRETFGPVAAIGVTSVGFALAHVATYWWGGSEVISAGVGLSLLSIAITSVVFGAIYEHTRNLTVVVLAHGLFNALLIAVSLAVALS